MKTKKITALFLISLLLSLPVFGHDLFFKLDSYFVKVNQKISISVMNGTFQKSEGAVTFARLTDMSVVSPSGAVSHPVEANLTKNETTAFLNVTPTEAGNYIAGLSTMWRESALPAAEFNKYLPAEGIPDI